MAFVRYFIWPNAKTYFSPPLESLLSYNAGSDEIDETAMKWFRYKSTEVTSVRPALQGSLLKPVIYFFCWLNFIFWAVSLLFLFRLRKYPPAAPLTRTLLLIVAFWIINFGFSIYASSIVFRYELFPMIVFTCFVCLLLDRLLPAGKTPSSQNNYHSPSIQ